MWGIQHLHKPTHALFIIITCGSLETFTQAWRDGDGTGGVQPSVTQAWQREGGGGVVGWGVKKLAVTRDGVHRWPHDIVQHYISKLHTSTRSIIYKFHGYVCLFNRHEEACKRNRQSNRYINMIAKLLKLNQTLATMCQWSIKCFSKTRKFVPHDWRCVISQ